MDVLWIATVRYKTSETIKLFCCPEDWTCELITKARAEGRQPGAGQTDAEWHNELCDFPPRSVAERRIIRMCEHCKIPVCRSCEIKLWQADGKSNVPMSLANDNWYGYVQDLIAKYNVRWIECACASICWTTQVIYHLEEPYGHLMKNDMRGPEARVAARGSVTSFPMPAEEILLMLQKAIDNSAMVPMPHDGGVLSILVRLHLSGKVDMKKYLKEFEIRAEVVVMLIRELISRGFPGYENYSIEEVTQRTEKLYGKCKSPKAGFVPLEVLKEVERAAKKTGPVQKEQWDKNATPAEPASEADPYIFEKARRQFIVAERDGDIGKDENATTAAAFGEFSDLKIETGSEMIDQWKPEYLCSAMPFTLALPVGSHDISGKERWRRPKEAAPVRSLDLVRGLPRRVEAQFRRHWNFMPMLWNLYFRENVNFGKQLYARQRRAAGSSDPTSYEHDDDDKTRTASKIYKRLQGEYRDSSGVKRQVGGDTTKLFFADGTTEEERRLLRDYEFLTGAIPGTQAIRRRMGNLGFAASLVYGTGIFITISPSERHGDLSIRLSRYREKDPLLNSESAAQEKTWIGKDKPSLETLGRDIGDDEPDYETRRLILARDPLCAVEAFSVYIRVVLACLLGIRMCPECPHCNHGKNPCQDKFGSNAEAQGGVLGRCDALFGAVESQKSGVLHYHFKAFVQRLHQYPNRHLFSL